MAKKIRNLDNIRIVPIKHLTPKLFQELNDIFSATYSGNSRKLKDDIAKLYDVAVMYDGSRMIGFITICDYTRMQEQWNIVAEHEIWDKNRPQNLNRRSIELCWVNHQYRGLGLATKLYQYALNNMAATQIHIEESRVYNRIDYWRSLGFTKSVLFAVNDDCPTMRLHVSTDVEYDIFFDLNQIDMAFMFADRGMTMELKQKQRQFA